jgi:hypothetical protein
MNSSLAAFFHAHQNQEAWWYNLKITPKLALHTANDALLPPDEAPGQFCISKLLGVTVNELWEALLREKMAKKKGERHSLDKDQPQEFVRSNELTNCLTVSESNKQLVMRVGFASTNVSAGKQWRSGETQAKFLTLCHCGILGTKHEFYFR